MSSAGPGASLSPLIHLIDDDEAVRSSLALLISTVGLRVQAWPDPQAPSFSTCACPASAA